MSGNAFPFRGFACFSRAICLMVLGWSWICPPASCQTEDPIPVLIIDGQNNHGIWPKTTVMIKKYLEETGLFRVEIARTKYTWQGEEWLDKYPLNDGVKRESVKEPKPDPDFRPEFSKYKVLVSNLGYGAAEWPEETRSDLEKFVFNGGGLVILHAANNSFGEWKAFNRMIGLGGWGGRNEKTGPYVYFDVSEKEVRDLKHFGKGK